MVRAQLFLRPPVAPTHNTVSRTVSVTLLLTTIQTSRKMLAKIQNTKIHENPCSESRTVPCGQTDRQTDATKIAVAFLYVL